MKSTLPKEQYKELLKQLNKDIKEHQNILNGMKKLKECVEIVLKEHKEL